eukprot:3909496-Pyramimonas_sp.AAC.1
MVPWNNHTFGADLLFLGPHLGRRPTILCLATRSHFRASALVVFSECRSRSSEDLIFGLPLVPNHGPAAAL